MPFHDQLKLLLRMSKNHVFLLFHSHHLAYNILFGRLGLKRLGAVPSTRHMKMKLPSLEGAVITINSDQKESKRCYENSLKMKGGVFSVTTKPPREDGVTREEIFREN